MDAILTNGTSGYAPQERAKDNNAFFRVMSKMAITEDQSIARISPGRPASIMKSNPERDSEIYFADLTCSGVTAPEIMFSINHIYRVGLDSGKNYYVYCLGIMMEASIDNDFTVATVKDQAVAAAAIMEAVQSGRISSYGDVSASLLSDPEIDFQLDWTQVIQRELFYGSSPAFSDVPYRVKSGVGVDSYSQWREISPCGVCVQHENNGASIVAHFDTGIVCSSVLSAHAPQEIEIAVESAKDIGVDYAMNLYLNIDDIPQNSLPWYVMHPGQYLHEVSVQYVFEGDVGGDGVTITCNEEPQERIKAGDIVFITSNGVTTQHEVESVSGQDITLVSHSESFASIVEVRKTGYDYLDGDLFGGDDPDLFRTPREARMFILRASVAMAQAPFLANASGAIFSLTKASYHYGVTRDYLYPGYAISNYGIDMSSGSYGESCNIDYDSVENMRYIGHYGRNPGFKHEVTSDHFEGLGIAEITAPISKKQAYVNDPAIVSAGKNSVEFDLSRIAYVGIKTVSQEVEGFYQVLIEAPPPPVVSMVSISKIYIAGDISGAVSAHSFMGGSMPYMALKTSTLRESISGEQDLFNIDYLAPALSMMGLIKINNELIMGILRDDKFSVLERGALGTFASAHGASDVVTIYDPHFKNEYIGATSLPIDSDITLHDAPEADIPSEGHVMINREIIGYSGIDGKILIVNQRGCFGTQRENHASGSKVTYLSYFTYGDIYPDRADICSYSGNYNRRISLPTLNENDPALYGAKPVYLIEVFYETNS